MEDPEENQETAVESIPVKAGIFDRLKALFSGAAGATVSVLGKLAMMLFALLMPLLLAAYPAYLLSARLLEYSAADTVEAKLTDIDVAMIQIDRDQASLFSARKHFEVIFHFRDGRDQAIEAVVQHPWPAPGLRRTLENDYATGDSFTLYRLPDRSLLMQAAVASDSFTRLTALMALVFLASGMFFLLWKRLANKWASLMPRFHVAITKSLMSGQLIALLLAVVLAVVISYSPTMVIPASWYLASYGFVSIFLAIALRLLVFEEPAAAQAPATEIDTFRE